MNNLTQKDYILVYSLLGVIIILGFYLCFIGGYGSDEDTLPMIYVFEAKIYDGRFVSSRFTGYPVAELGIGFLAFNFGSFAANSVTYLLFLVGLVLLFWSFENEYNINRTVVFILLCLTNPILFFDNLEPVDYSWAFFFFALGAFFFKKNIFELAVLFFGISIGVRINYVLFVLIFILLFETNKELSIYRRFILFFSTFIIGGLFYLPIWYEYQFKLSWLTAARPNDQGMIGILARFFYKSYISVGYLSSFFIFFYLIKKFFLLNKIKNFKLILGLSISNLLIFLWIPAEYSYLQLFLVLLFLLIYYLSSKYIIYSLCLLNIISWFIFFDPIKINYFDETYCGPKKAKSISLEPKLERGFYFKYIESRDKIKCWVYGTSERDIKILSGKPLKKNK